MRCPYCASEVPQTAIVCPHCTRDFYLFKPLLERIEQLESRLAERTQVDLATYDARIAALERELVTLQAAQPAGPAPSFKGDEVPLVRDNIAWSSVSGRKPYWVSLTLALGSALALLVLAHILLLFVYDVKPIYLRIASIVIPSPFGFALVVWHPNRFRNSAIAGFAMATLAVWLMLVNTAAIDSVPVMPQSMRDVREIVEYMASIGLAFLAGLLLGKLHYRRLQVSSEPNRLAVFLAELFSADKDGELAVLRLATRIQKTLSTLTPIGAWIASVYAGIKALFGDMG
jgi:hypothetical protein